MLDCHKSAFACHVRSGHSSGAWLALVSSLLMTLLVLDRWTVQGTCHGLLPLLVWHKWLRDLEARVPSGKIHKNDILGGDRLKLREDIVPELPLICSKGPAQHSVQHSTQHGWQAKPVLTVHSTVQKYRSSCACRWNRCCRVWDPCCTMLGRSLWLSLKTSKIL